MPPFRTVICPHCKGRFPVDTTLAGQVLACPHCRGQLRLPTSLSPPPPSAPPSTPPLDPTNPYASPAPFDTHPQPTPGGYADSVAASAASAKAGEALTYAIIGFFCCWPILEPIAIVKALDAQKTLARYPGAPGGGKATAALVIAIVTIGIGVLGIVAQFAMLAADM